ncbi:MAG: NAD(P)/FAD-dependent oxidoreductase [Deltaproteobacteria bacterium]|nr:NAD(P)/FAD-dependent oxidoreductase [Deltaproteobacteria bacterium]
MSGILSAIKLQEAGFDDLTIYEKAPRLGGTWRENTYPGIACDVPSHLYSYSFAPNPDWTHRFSPGAEIQQYLEDVAKRFDVERLIRANTEIRRCAWLDGRWEIETAEGEIDHADFIIAATGVLHHPNIPSIPGLESFAGSSFHSARWDHEIKLEGKRVGVIGTGSSAVQIVSALVDRVAEISLFQRTPQWIMPQENPPFSEDEKSDFRSHPETMTTLRAEVSQAFTDHFSNAVVDADSPQMKLIEELCVANLEQNVTDPELREQLRPDYRAACKRLVISEDFYQAIQKPNAKLVVDAIEQIEPAGVRTANGELHELDVLVLATGFQVDRFMRPIQILGKDGIDLDQIWAERPSAYLAISVPELPNLFMLNGPNGPVGNFSLIDVAELQFGYIMQLVQEVLDGRCREISASRAATDRFERERVEAAKTTVWTTGCRSWYLDDRGIPAVWPWTFDRFREEMFEPTLQDYDRN